MPSVRRDGMVLRGEPGVGVRRHGSTETLSAACV